MNMLLGHKPKYNFIKRQINKIKGWEVSYTDKENIWGIKIGFFKTMAEANEAMIKDKKQRSTQAKD